MGLLNKLIDFDPIIDRAVLKASEQIPPLMDELENRFKALLPLVVATAVKAMSDELSEHVPDIPIVGDVIGIADRVRDALNQIPDIDIPGPSDKFDLTEFLKKLGQRR